MIAPKRRIALYSPGMVGLGHVRRNLLVAQALSARPARPATVLLVAEAREASALATPPGVDSFTLPALRKDANGQAHSRYLDLPLDEVVALRAQVIQSVLEAFAPDVLIVDHLPRGAQGEMEPALEALRRRGGTRCVLGLRDVLGAPETVKRDWEACDNLEAIRAYYDAVWIYGDPAVYDLVREYDLPLDVVAKTRYTGYLDHRARLQFAERNGANPLPALGLPPDRRLMVCLVGGGQDGRPLAEAFVQADMPPDASGIVVTGPFMPPADRRRVYALAARRPDVRVIEFLSEPALLMRRADRIVAMGGYNTVWEMLSFRKRALIVPRMRPGREQLIRAERLRALGVVEMLTPAAATPDALGAWLASEAAAPPGVRARLDLSGLARLPRFLDDVLDGREGVLTHEVEASSA